MLKQSERKRLKFVQLEEATYIISNYRPKNTFTKELVKFLNDDYPYVNKVFSVEVDDVRLLAYTNSDNSISQYKVS